LTEEERESKLFILEYSKEQIEDPVFLQGMFNYIIVEGGKLYWDRKARGDKALGLDADLLDEIIQVPSHDFQGWFDAVTTVDPESRLSINTLYLLYLQQEGSRIDKSNFMSLIKKWVPGAKNAFYRSSENGLSNQYFVRGWKIHGDTSTVLIGEGDQQQSVRVMGLAEWFGNYYQPDSASFPFLNDVRIQYNLYLSQLNLPPESEKGFSSKLSNALPTLVINKKQGKIEGKISTKLRVWSFQLRSSPLEMASKPSVELKVGQASQNPFSRDIFRAASSSYRG
jgi:hypothetical protein